MHGNHPQPRAPDETTTVSDGTAPPAPEPGPIRADLFLIQHSTGSRHPRPSRDGCQQQDHSTPLNPRRRPLGRLPLARQLSRSDMQPNDGMPAGPHGPTNLTRVQRRTRT
jgi:hypothetical protein